MQLDGITPELPLSVRLLCACLLRPLFPMRPFAVVSVGFQPLIVHVRKFHETGEPYIAPSTTIDGGQLQAEQSKYYFEVSYVER